jgi:hypothetical protein
MNIVERARRLCLSPDTEWPVIAGESAPLAALLTGYVLPLAALSAIGSFVSAAMAGLGLMTWFVLLATSLLMSLVGVVVLSFVIDALAPAFGAEKSAVRAGNVAAYSPTAAWVAGSVQFVPIIGGLIAALGALYTLYLLYLGLLRVMKSPPDKAAIYTVVVVVVAIVIGVVVNVIAGALGLGTGLMPAYTLG